MPLWKADAARDWHRSLGGIMRILSGLFVAALALSGCSSIPKGRLGPTMRFSAILTVAGLALMGCSGVPKSMQNPVSPVSVDQLILAVQCEYFTIYELDEKVAALFGDWVAGTDYDLKVTDGVVFKPGLTITPPVGEATVVLAGSTGVDDRSVRQQTFRLFTDLSKIKPNTDNGRKLKATCPPSNSPDSSRGLQIGARLRALATGMAAAGIPQAALAIPVQKLTFTVDRSVGTGLTFKVAEISVKAENSSTSRKLENSITITLRRHSDPINPAELSVAEDDVYRQLNEALDELKRKDDELVLRPGDKLTVVPAEE